MIALDAEQVWAIGESVAVVRGRTLRARLTLTVRAVVDAGLLVHPDNSPQRHAGIRGWPTEKEEQMEKALLLHAAAEPEMRKA